MNAEDPGLWAKYGSHVITAAFAVVGAFWAGAKWLGTRFIDRHDKLEARVDKLERDYVSRDEHNATIAALRREIAEGNKGTHDRLDKIMIILATSKPQT